MNIIYQEHVQRVPIWSWCRKLEPGARQQAIEVSAHPQVRHHVALMPDAHQGFGMPIGAVAALADAVCPNMVGVDIACGMLAARLDLPATAISNDEFETLLRHLRATIPMGFNRRRDRRFHREAVALLSRHRSQLAAVTAGHDLLDPDLIATQLGTLGGGNHFLEWQADEAGQLWLMLHSGSRNLGKRVCETYHRLACEYDARHRLPCPSRQLAWLPDDSPPAQSYLALLELCLDFSRANRELMLQLAAEALAATLGHPPAVLETCNIHHNYAAREVHYGEELWVHRKGATAARAGEPGIIPGSMGSASFLVRGKGNPASFASCSHGAGRAMSREEARRTLSLADFRHAMAGIVGRTDRDLLDESPMAYKDITQVMAEQQDLVEITHRLRPLAVAKG